MSYHFIGLNNRITYGFGGCCNSFTPFVPYSFNYCYNPFTVFNTAMQLMGFNSQPLFSAPKVSYNQTFPNLTLPSYSLWNSNYNPQNYNSLYDGVGFYAPKNYTLPNTGTIAMPQFTGMPQFDDMKDLSYGTGRESTYSLYSSKTPDDTFKPSYTTLSANHLNKEFLEKVKQVAKNLNCNYEDLLAVMNSESGLQPDKWNGSSAVGLIQFTNSALAELKRVYGINLTKEQVSKMSALEQLDLAEKYLKITTKKFGGKKLSAADLYASVYLPGRAKNEVLTRRGENYYDGNKGLDENRDGIITKTDLNNHLAKKRVRLETFA